MSVCERQSSEEEEGAKGMNCWGSSPFLVSFLQEAWVTFVSVSVSVTVSSFLLLGASF